MAAGRGFNLLYPLLFSIITNCGLVGIAISMSSDYTALEARIKDMTFQELIAENPAAKKKDDEYKLLLKKTQRINKLVTGSEDEVDGDRIRNMLLDVFGKIEEIRNDPEKKIQEDLIANKLEGQGYTNLLQVPEDLLKLIRIYRNEYIRVRIGVKTHLEDLEQLRQTRQQNEVDLNKQITDWKQKFVGEQDARRKDNEKKDTRIQGLIADNGLVKKQMAEMESEHKNQIARRESKISELQLKINEIMKKKERTLASTQPDGVVVHSDAKIGYAWIDLGKKHGIIKGHQFDVIQFVKGGRQKLKGKVEVKQVDPDKSQVALLTVVDPTDPIVKGDYVISPLFDKNETQEFVFAGALVKSPYGKPELTRMIEGLGAKVAQAVTIETDFLVAGKGAEESEDFERAVQFGVVIMREHELLDYLGR